MSAPPNVPRNRIAPPMSIGINKPIGFDPSVFRNTAGVGNNPTVFIPKTRGLPPDHMWEERCECTPPGQKWGVALLTPTPTAPGKHDQFVVVFLDAFRSEVRAKACQRRMSKRHSTIVFEMGQWLALPVPTWLQTEDQIVDYNLESVCALMKYDTARTKIKQEVMRRRAKNSATVKESISPSDETKKLEPGSGDYWAGRSQSPSLPNSSVNYESHYKVGLAWVLPNVQCPGLQFTNMAFAFLGAYEEECELDLAQAKIKETYPEWSIVAFDMCKPLEIPVPSWLMQRDMRVKYDQETMTELMMHQAPPLKDVGPPPTTDDATIRDVVTDIAGPEIEIEIEHENERVVSVDEISSEFSSFRITATGQKKQ